MSLNLPYDRQYPGFLLVYDMLPIGSSINVNQDKFGWIITYPDGVKQDLVEYVNATPGLGQQIVQANLK